jgi:hypothetical protein
VPGVADQVTPTPLRIAVEARDLDAVVASMAPDVVLRSPIFELPFEGIDEARDLFESLLDVLWPITSIDEIPGDPYILHFTGEIKGKTLEGVDLLRFDDEGRITEFTVFFRPFPAVAAFLSATGPRLARRRRGVGTAATITAANAPVAALMRATAAAGPRLLGLKSSRRSS